VHPGSSNPESAASCSWSTRCPRWFSWYSLQGVDEIVQRVAERHGFTVQEALRDPVRVFGFAIAMALDLRELPVEGADLNPQEFERIVRGGVASPGRNYPLFDHSWRLSYSRAPTA
jgi:hypothetical protein